MSSLTVGFLVTEPIDRKYTRLSNCYGTLIHLLFREIQSCRCSSSLVQQSFLGPCQFIRKLPCCVEASELVLATTFTSTVYSPTQKNSFFLIQLSSLVRYKSENPFPQI